MHRLLIITLAVACLLASGEASSPASSAPSAPQSDDTEGCDYFGWARRTYITDSDLAGYNVHEVLEAKNICFKQADATACFVPGLGGCEWYLAISGTVTFEATMTRDGCTDHYHGEAPIPEFTTDPFLMGGRIVTYPEQSDGQTPYQMSGHSEVTAPREAPGCPTEPFQPIRPNVRTEAIWFQPPSASFEPYPYHTPDKRLIQDISDRTEGPHSDGFLFEWSFSARKFDWRMPDRFGLDEDANGLIDYRTTPEEVQQQVIPVDLIAPNCNPQRTYTWQADGEPLQTVREDCVFTAQFPNEGTYDVTMSIDGTEIETNEVIVQDFLIVSIGDSAPSGEGAPDKALTGSSPAIWQDRDCHRSALAGPPQAALRIEDRDPRTSVTFVHLACSGAKILGDIIPATAAASISGTTSGLSGSTQLSQLVELTGDREIDAILVNAGANDVGFGPIVNFCARYDSCDERPFSEDIEVSTVAGGLQLPIPRSPEPVVTQACGPNPPGQTLIGVLNITQNIPSIPPLPPPKIPIEPGWTLSIQPGEESQETHKVVGTDYAFCPDSVLNADKHGVIRLDQPLEHDQTPDLTPDPLPFRPNVVAIPPTLTEFVDQRLAELRDVGGSFDRLAERLSWLSDADRIYATEYFDPTSGEGGETCDKMLDISVPVVLPDAYIDKDEAQWARARIVAGLNSAAFIATERHGWNYVDGITFGFSGRGYCAGDDARWIRTLGESFAIQLDHLGTMHPNEQGHAFIADRLVEDLLEDLYEQSFIPREPGGARGTTILDEPANAGDTMLATGDTGNFAAGDQIAINPGGDNEETNTVTGLGSLLLASPLLHDHAAGEPILKVASPSGAIPGDVDCDDDVDSVDALTVLRDTAGLPVNADCLAAADVDCDGDADAVDALFILRHVAGLPNNPPAGCPPIGLARGRRVQPPLLDPSP